jgi:ABC-type branched-subunit amino acid transport system permease subunit
VAVSTPARTPDAALALTAGRLAPLSGFAIAAALLLYVGLWGRSYSVFIVELMIINAIAAVGVNIAMGFAGLVSIGHAGFAAIGAYTTTLLMIHWNVPFLAALPAGAAAAGVAGIAIGLPALRLSPLYIAMVTFGFGQAVALVALNWLEMTRGPNGLTVPEPTWFGMPLSAGDLYALSVVLLVLAFALSWNIRRTRFGRALMALRSSPILAQSMGIPVARYKTIAFAVSGCYGGISGGLYAAIAGFINPEAFSFGVSIHYVTMTVVGGIGTLSGPVIGAFVLTLLPEALRAYAEYKEFVAGLILLVFIVVLPGGLVGFGRNLTGRLLRGIPV